MTTPSLITAVALGSIGGAGAWLVASGWRPAVEPLSVALARFGHTPSHREAGRSSDRNVRLGVQVRRIGPIERRLRGLEQDLRLLEQTPDEVAAGVGACALLGFFLGALLLVPQFAGLPIPIWIAGWVSLGGAVAGAAFPLMEAKDKASKRRTAFQHALSAYCVSVDMCLQVGAGPEQALLTAADGTGWHFARLRGALKQAQVRNEEPWAALRRLGEEIDVPDLVELAKSVEQVAVKGASVGDTVSGIADSIQARIAAGIETDATRRTVRMAIPTTMLLMGFMLLVAYPLARVVFGGT
jgi:Flp pilus assembly protein TadB